MLTFNRSRKTRIAWATLGIGCLASVFAALQVRQDIEQAAVRQFAFNCDQVAIKIQERLGAYALILRGGAALFAASATVERNAWRAYVETLRASGSVPGVQGIGFAEVIPPEELAAHVERIRDEGFPDYRVRPPGARALYTSIIYLEPFRDRNLRAFGFDMYAEPVRRAAMDRARDSGEAALSGKVELVQETGTQIQAGTLLYVPVYRNRASTDTLEQRRAALLGWAYSPYRMHDLMTGILGDGESHAGKTLDLTIYDGRDVSPAGLLFDSRPDRASAVHSPFYQPRTLDLHGRPWRLVFDRTASAPGIGNASAWTTLAGGLALSGLLFWLILALINTRENAARIAGKLTAKSRRHEALLSESEAFKNAILNAVSAEIAVVGRDGSILAVNELWRRFAVDNGNEPGQSALQTDVGINYLEVCRTDSGGRAEEDGSSAGAGIRAVLDGRLPSFRLEYPCHSPTQQRWFMMGVTPLARGTVAGAVITHTDITERKQAELALRQSETKFRALFDATSDAVMLLDEEGFLGCNKATLAVFGCATPEEFCSYHPADLSPPQQPCGTDSMTLSNRHIAIAMKNGSRRFEWMHKRLDNGQTFIAEVLLSAVPLEDRTILLASLHDITERRRIAAVIAETRTLLLTVIDTVPIRVFWKDRNLRYLGCNTAFARDAGMTHPRDVIGKDDHQMSWAAQAERYRADDRAVMASGLPKLSYDEPQTTPSGQTIWLRTSKVALRDRDNAVFGLLGI